MTGRATAIARTRSALAELQEKYGLKLGGTETETFYQWAVRLGATRSILSPSKTVILCSAELRDMGTAEPCLIVPSALPVELLPPHHRIAVGSQVLSISRTPLALPKYVMDASWRAFGFWKGSQLPVLVSISGEYRYLVRPNSYFFKCGQFTGADLDQNSPVEPNEDDLKLNRYSWGDDLTSQLTIVVAEY